MEYWFAATGPFHWKALFESHMQSQPMVIEGLAPNGTKFQQNFNGILEPITLYRYIIPEPALPMVVNTLGQKAPPHGTLFNIGTAALRKSLGLEPIPEFPQTPAKLNVSLDFMHIIPIGIRREEPRIMHATGVKQEPI